MWGGWHGPRWGGVDGRQREATFAFRAAEVGWLYAHCPDPTHKRHECEAAAAVCVAVRRGARGKGVGGWRAAASPPTKPTHPVAQPTIIIQPRQRTPPHSTPTPHPPIHPPTHKHTVHTREKMPADLLHPLAADEARKHKLKRLVQSPNSFFMDVKCQGCFNITTIFSHAQVRKRERESGWVGGWVGWGVGG